MTDVLDDYPAQELDAAELDAVLDGLTEAMAGTVVGFEKIEVARTDELGRVAVRYRLTSAAVAAETTRLNSEFSADAPVLSGTPATGETGVAFSWSPALSGGTGTLTYSVVSGTLPDGLVLDAGSGVVSGTPTMQETQAVTLKVVDERGFASTLACTFNVLDITP